MIRYESVYYKHATHMVRDGIGGGGNAASIPHERTAGGIGVVRHYDAEPRSSVSGSHAVTIPYACIGHGKILKKEELGCAKICVSSKCGYCCGTGMIARRALVRRFPQEPKGRVARPGEQ